MRAGLLRHQIVIQQESSTPDGMGGYSVGWNTFATVHASVQPLSGQEAVAARQLEDTVTHKIQLRHLSGLTAKMRVSFGGRLFNIREVRNIDERNRVMELRVEEGVAT